MICSGNVDLQMGDVCCCEVLKQDNSKRRGDRQLSFASLTLPGNIGGNIIMNILHKTHINIKTLDFLLESFQNGIPHILVLVGYAYS